jgi:hypothetical protein
MLGRGIGRNQEHKIKKKYYRLLNKRAWHVHAYWFRKKQPYRSLLPSDPQASFVACNPSAAALYPCLPAVARSSKHAGRVNVDG